MKFFKENVLINLLLMLCLCFAWSQNSSKVIFFANLTFLSFFHPKNYLGKMLEPCQKRAWCFFVLIYTGYKKQSAKYNAGLKKKWSVLLYLFCYFYVIEIIFAYLNCFYLNFKLNLTKHCKFKVISKCFEHERKIMIFKVKILKSRMDELWLMLMLRVVNKSRCLIKFWDISSNDFSSIQKVLRHLVKRLYVNSKSSETFGQTFRQIEKFWDIW